MRVASKRSGLRWSAVDLVFVLINGLTVLMIMAAANCGRAEPEPVVEIATPVPTATSTATPDRTKLPGDATWVLESLDGQPIVEGSFVTLEIGEDRLGGYDGCNSYGGRSEVEASIVDTDGMFSAPSVGITARLCHEPMGVMDQAEAYLSALMAGERYQVADDRMEVYDGGGEVRLEFARQVPLTGRAIDLSGTVWRLIGDDIDADSDVRVTTMAFLDDRLVIGDTACRSYLATYSGSEEGVRFPSQSMLQRSHSCSDDARMREGAFGDFLTWAREYAAHGEGRSRRLRMRSAEGRTLTFEPLPPSVEDVSDAEWILVAIVELQQDEFGMWLTRTSRAAEGADLTLRFEGEGVYGSTGCNSYGAEAKVGDGSIAIDAETFLLTALGCYDLDGVMEQEERFVDVLPRVERYGVFGNHLVIQTNDDVFLLFRAG